MLTDLQAGVVSNEQVTAHGLSRHSIARLVAGPAVAGARPRHLLRGLPLSGVAGMGLGGSLDRRRSSTTRRSGWAHLHGLIGDCPDRILVLVLVPDHTRRKSLPPWIFRRLRVALQDRPQCRRRRLLQELLTDTGEGAESVLELRYLRDLERAHRLPSAERQSVRAAARSERGSRAFRDVYYGPYGVVVELDGRTGHTDAGRLRDLRRDTVSSLRGGATLRYGWQDVVDEPCVVACQVAALLARRGWTGAPTRSPRCDRVPDAVLAELPAG